MLMHLPQRIEQVPLSDWFVIYSFALTFDGAAYWGSFHKAAEIANRASKRYDINRKLPTSLTDLRTCLFFEQRRWRHLDQEPTGDWAAYIAALLDAIRQHCSIPAFTAVPEDVRAPLLEAAERWKAAGTQTRPRVEAEVLAHWDRIIAEWIDDHRMPLLVRNPESGKVLEHVSGRTILCVDNSPANWCLSSALLGRRPSVQELRLLLVATGYRQDANRYDQAKVRLAIRGYMGQRALCSQS